jgi:hypothetical protein
MNNPCPQEIDIRLNKGARVLKAFTDSISDYFMYKRRGAELYHVIFVAAVQAIVLYENTLHHAGPKARLEKLFKVSKAKRKSIIKEICAILEGKGWETMVMNANERL